MYLDKTVVCPGQGMHKKGINTLLVWLIKAVKEFIDLDLRSVVTMIMNWNNGDNDIMSFSL